MNAYEEEIDGRVVKVKYKKGRRTDQLHIPKRHRAKEKRRERPDKDR